MENIHAQPLGNPPYSARIRVRGYAFVDHAGRRQRQWTIDDIRVARDPADVRHAPIHIFGMNILNVLRGAGHIRQVAARAMLASLRLSSAAAGVHEKQRSLRIHREGSHNLTRVVRQNLVHPEIAAFHKRRSGRALARLPPPHQDLIYLMSFLGGYLKRDVGRRFVIEHLAITVIAVHRDQHMALGIRSACAASLAAESAKYDRVDYRPNERMPAS